MSTEAINVAEIFGQNVFDDTVMQERLPKKIYKNLKHTIEEGRELDLETADVIDLTKQMKKEAAELNFESAAELRDKLTELKKMLNEIEG